MNRGGTMSHNRSNNNQYRNDRRNAPHQGGHMNYPRGSGGNFNHQNNQNQNAQNDKKNTRENTNTNVKDRQVTNNSVKNESPMKSSTTEKPADEKAKVVEESSTSNNAETEMESTTEKPPEKKFTGRCRLFVGNITPDISEDEFKKLFEPYGEVSEVYVNSSRGFGFIRLDYRHNAEAAKAALDGMQRKGRVLRIRFATHGAALKVKNLHSYVSNELLEESFSQFGDLERCIVIVDDRGKSTGEGIVEFMRKPGANSALRRISEGVFLMGVDPRPIHVEPLEQKDEEDGMPEKFLVKTEQYKKEREKEPRFAPPGTFEYEFGMRWKQLEDLEKQRIEQIKKDTEEARIKLEDEMQNALYEYQADQIRQDLLRQQEELRRLEEHRTAERQRRLQDMERRREQIDRSAEERRRADLMMNIRQQEIATRTAPMDERDLRREQQMMMDRFGDRIPERMGDRMGDRMGERIGDRMGERLGDRMGDRLPNHMGDRMSDRMGDRMSDHMGDRMPDRMGPGSERMGPDRMGPGPDRMGPGPDRMGPGPDRMGPGPDRMGPGPDRMGLGPDRMGLGPDRMGPGHDRMGPGLDRMGQGMDRMGPGMDRMGPGMDRMGPGMDRMGPGMDRLGPGSDRMGPGSDRMGPGNDRMGPGMDRMGSRADRTGPGMDRMPERMGERSMAGQPEGRGREREGAMRGENPRGRESKGPGGAPPQSPAVTSQGVSAADQKSNSNTGPKPLMANLPGIGEKSNGSTGTATKAESAADGPMKRKAGPEGGNSRESGYQGQRGVLGSAPTGMGGHGGSPLGEAARAAAAAAAALSQMRGVPGAQAMVQNQQAQALHERMLLERRREAAREELSEIKRMRRM